MTVEMQNFKKIPFHSVHFNLNFHKMFLLKGNVVARVVRKKFVLIYQFIFLVMDKNLSE